MAWGDKIDLVLDVQGGIRALNKEIPVGSGGPLATFATDPLTGNVTGLVGPSGALASIPFIPNGGQAAIPVILPSSGTITNGVLSALTALPIAYGGAWMYFPAGASLPSGRGLPGRHANHNRGGQNQYGSAQQAKQRTQQAVDGAFNATPYNSTSCHNHSLMRS